MMERLTSTPSLTILFLCLFWMNNATGIEININPVNPTETLDNSVGFACTLGQNINDYKEVYVMSIVKDNKKQIAALTASGITFKHGDVEKRYQANGVLNNIVAQTYLNLTLLLPRVEDSGYYGCVISYLDHEGILQQDKDVARLVVKMVDSTNEHYLQIVVNSLVRRVEMLEASDEQNEIDKASLRSQLKDQKEIQDMKKRMDALADKINYKSLFSATIKEKNARVPLSPGTVIVFDDVVQRQGNDYNEKTGVFTAHEKGVYTFHLTLGTWSQTASFTNVHLKVNGQSRASLQTTNYNSNNGGNQDQTEISLVVALNSGDQVKAMTSADTSSGEQMIGNLCLFSGYLVRRFD